MKSLTMRFLTLFGIALLATVMAFSLASCKQDGGDDDDDGKPKIPYLQYTRWENDAGDIILFSERSVTVTTASGGSQTFTLKDSQFVGDIDQTTLFFSDDKTIDQIVYRNNKITMVNFNIIDIIYRTNNWSKKDFIVDDFILVYGGSDFKITGYTGNGGSVDIPASIDGKPVIFISDSAFASCNLTSVTIPNSVFAIFTQAFYKNSLTSITIGANVNISNAFEDESGSIGFLEAYDNGGKKAGTYTRPNTTSTTWTKQ